jgi:hypothetical protein
LRSRNQLSPSKRVGQRIEIWLIWVYVWTSLTLESLAARWQQHRQKPASRRRVVVRLALVAAVLLLPSAFVVAKAVVVAWELWKFFEHTGI